MFPFSLHSHNDDTSVGLEPGQRHQRTLRKAKSHYVISPLIDLVRDPAGSIGYALGGQWQQDVAERKKADELKQKEDAEFEAQRQVLSLRMKEADSYEKWYAAAIALDALEGNDAWKAESLSSGTSPSYYNAALLTHYLHELDEARLNCDARRMLFLIRTTLSRNLGGMNNLKLYRHSHVGTKLLIERYIESALATMKSLLEISAAQSQSISKKINTDEEPLEPRMVLEQLLAARQAFGRSALLLSGGGTFGMNHIGVVKCLWEQNLLPRIVSGSSAGSIVCAVLCTRGDAEIPKILDEMCSGDLAVFEDPEDREREGLFGALKRFLTHGAVFESKHLVRVMRDLLGDITFQEAYNRTRRILNICVSSASIFELPRLLNYVTAPNVIIWSAVATSCSVPLVFTPSSILAKDPKTGAHIPWNGPSPSLTAQRWIDGSVDNDLPMTRLAEMFNVNHFIVSQVNPHVVPFLRSEEGARAEANTTDGGITRGWLNTAAVLAKGELIHRMHVLTDMHIFPTTLTKARSILSQRYSGDITILPEIPYSQFPLVLQNPTPEFMVGAMRAGERATWPKLSRIRNALNIEMALDEAVGDARGRVVFSKSQVDLRLGAFGRSTLDSRRGRRQRNGRNELWRHSSAARLDTSQETTTLGRGSGKPNERLRARKPPGRLALPKVTITADKVASFSSATVDDDDSHSDERKIRNMFALSSSPLSSPDSSSTELDGSDLDRDYLDIRNSGPMTAVPELWPTTRPFFPTVSQPSTPYPDGRPGLSSSNLIMTPGSPATLRKSTTAPAQQHIPTPSPPGKQSEVERRYKRLFHRRSSPSAQATPPSISSMIPTQPKHSPRASDSVLSMTSITDPQLTDRGRDTTQRRKSIEAGALYSETIPLDISGTRGMMLRRKSQRKRSLSTGMKGLVPPTAR